MWRMAIQDLEGTAEFPSWSPEPVSELYFKNNIQITVQTFSFMLKSHRTQKNNVLIRLWKSLSGWLSLRQAGSPHDVVHGSGVSLYIL